MNSILVKQKKIFLDGEGDNWFLRNRKHLKNRAIKKKIIIHNAPFDLGFLNGELNVVKKKLIDNLDVEPRSRWPLDKSAPYMKGPGLKL